MLITTEMIYKKLLSLEKEIKEIKEKEIILGLEEFSLTKAANILHISKNAIRELIENGEIKARRIKTQKGISYRIPAREIYNFQNNNIIEYKTSCINIKSIISNFHKERSLS